MIINFMSYSQIGQDLFVLKILENYDDVKSYLEIGASHPTINSNTMLLEKNGWTGYSIEIEDIKDIWYKERKNDLLICDATTVDYNLLFANEMKNNCTYLSIDTDGNYSAILKKILETEQQFMVITIEHDLYRLGRSEQFNEHILLTNAGYICLAKNISMNNLPFEDWWINTTIVKKYMKNDLLLCGICNREFDDMDHKDLINKLMKIIL